MKRTGILIIKMFIAGIVISLYCLISIAHSNEFGVVESDETQLEVSKDNIKEKTNSNAQQVYLSENFKKLINQNAQISIAVFPMQNMSVDGEVAYHFRQRVIEQLRAKGFNIVAPSRIDNMLYDMGVTNADQIRLVDLKKLLTAVKADGYVFGLIEQAVKQNAVAYNSYVYTSSLKMHGGNGDLYWSALQERVAKRRFAIDPINAILDVFLVESGGDKKDAVYALADRLLSRFPNGPVKVIISDSLLDQAKEVKVKNTDKKSISETGR